jgi:hypothetical protein
MSTAAFEAKVSREIKRGTVFDTDIPDYAFYACQMLDRLHPWVHMWHEVFGATLAAETATIDVPVVNDGLVQSVKYLRWTFAQPESDFAFRWHYAKKSKPEELGVNRVISQPNKVKWWMIDRNTIGMNGTFAEAQVYDIGFYEETVWDDNNPWLTIDPRLLLAQTMLEMQPLLKDDKLVGRYTSIVQKRIAALENADYLHTFDGLEMVMTPFADEMEAYGLDSHGSERA